MKRIISCIIALCAIITCFVISGSAEGMDTLTFYYDNDVEVIIEINDDLTYDQMKHIADTLAGGGILNEGSAGGGEGMLLHPQCAAGNHDITTTNATIVRHNVYPAPGKCAKDVYSVETCTRIGCYYEVYNLLYSERIATCHG